MKNSFPFSDYDFWGYLACGFTMLGALDYVAFNGIYVLVKEITFSSGIILTALAYVTGHVLASFSNTLIGYSVVRKMLGDPVTLLLSPPTNHNVRKFLFPEFHRPLSKRVRDLVSEKTLREHGQCSDWEIAQIAHNAAKNLPATKQRMDNFLNLYGFCRNMAGTGLLIVCMLMGYASADKNIPLIGYCISVSLFLSIGMFWRYLKFYRAYNAEILTSYALSQ